MKQEANSLKDQLQNVIEEARMVLPGVQALFGFQTIAVFNQRFGELSLSCRNIHLAALALVVLAIALLMAPAAYHRIVEPHRVSQRTLNISSLLICVSLLPLALALAMDLFVVFVLGTDEPIASAAAALVAFTLLMGLWFVFPFQQRRANSI
jgi:hypothetical protein